MRVFLICISTFLLMSGNPVRANNDFPSRNIRIIVPFLAGAAPDAIARIVAEELSKRVKQPVIVENRTGAGGTIGAAYVAKAAPDGYTLLLATEAPMGISPKAYKNLPYDPVKNFEPISLLASSGFYVVGCPQFRQIIRR